ncbi:MAG: adenylosuccinate lyase [Opitutales bacterium]|nr:adenylosuccinate lyase [Opitutales bacterium]
MEAVLNVLADRYASREMVAIWSAEGKVRMERSLWIAVMRAQRDLGLEIPSEAIEAYEKVRDRVDLEDIKARERVSRHDVKARIESFCAAAGYEYVHMGMTSRDLTENVEQLQVKHALETTRDKMVAVLSKLAVRATESRDTPLAARTHNVVAQVTTVGKRWAMFGEESLFGFEQLDALLKSYPLRGLKGAVGTQKDTLQLFDGDAQRAADLESAVRQHLGFESVWDNVGQVYPRSLDATVINTLVELASGMANFSKTLRLMAGQELASEGFAPGQTGSSAMPHKMNSRSTERINGFHTILKGYQTMANGLAGDQWNEGDVSCSVVRRVCLPDAFFAMDGLIETMLTVLNQMEVNRPVIDCEVAHYLPFLASTALLMAAVQSGMGREAAHARVKHHAVEALRKMRSGESSENGMIAGLGADDSFPLNLDEMNKILEHARAESGVAASQVDAFVEQVSRVAQRYPEAVKIEPGDIL